MPMFKAMLVGAIMVSAWAISVFFFRFWRKTNDRLFAFFAAAFLLLGIERVSISFIAIEAQAYVYLIRLLAFALILIAIIDKNRKGSEK